MMAALGGAIPWRMERHGGSEYGPESRRRPRVAEARPPERAPVRAARLDPRADPRRPHRAAADAGRLRDEPVPDRAGQGRPDPVRRAPQLPRPVAADDEVLAAIPRTLFFAAMSTAITLPLALVTALVLNRGFRGVSIFFMALLMPWAVASIVAGIFWRSIFDTNFGIVNGVLVGLGLMDEPFNWLASTAQAVGIALVAQSWRSVPLLAVLLLAASEDHPAGALPRGEDGRRDRVGELPLHHAPGDQDHPDRGRRAAGHHRAPGLRPAVQPHQRRPGSRHVRPDQRDLRHHVRTISLGYGAAITVVLFLIIVAASFLLLIARVRRRPPVAVVDEEAEEAAATGRTSLRLDAGSAMAIRASCAGRRGRSAEAGSGCRGR